MVAASCVVRWIILVRMGSRVECFLSIVLFIPRRTREVSLAATR